MSRILWRSSLRYLLRHPWQIGLAILGVALGVAVVISIDLANQSAHRAFELSTETVAGRATHQIIGGPTGLPEETYTRLRLKLGLRASAPVVEANVASPSYPGRVFHLLGVDPFAEKPFRPYLSGAEGQGSDLSRLLTDPNAVALSAETAQQLGLAQGDRLELRVGSLRRPVVLEGLLDPADPLSRRALASLLVADIATAQELLGMEGRLSRIDLIVPEGQAGMAVLERIRAELPPGAQVLPAASRSQAIEQMTRSFNLNLAALSLLALIVGMFLIYNTMTFSVVQRRTLIGTLRAIGVTRREVFVLVVAEALVVGTAGTAIGLPLGIVLGRGLIKLVTRTINDLYFVVSVTELTIPPGALVKGLGLGLCATLLAALVPALEATSAPPRAVLSRSTIETRLRRAIPRAALGGAALLLAGIALLLIPSKSVRLSFLALWLILFGFALLTPVVTIMLMRLLRPLMGLLFGVLGRMSARGVVVALSRTAVAIAALMIAVSVTVGIGIMIGSFRQTVVDWLEQSLRADIYISPAGLIGNHSTAALDPGLVEQLAATPGIADVTTYRAALIESPDRPVQLLAVQLSPHSRQSFNFKAGDPAALWPMFQSGEAVLISEPYAYRHEVQLGSSISLRTEQGERAFSVAGIFYDYGSDQGVIMMNRQTYDRYWNDPAISSLGVYAEPGVDIDSLIAALRLRAGEHELQLQSNRALREASLDVFDRTFAITGVLRLLATVVAFIGVLSALMALQLERTRELGVLRANGLTPRQVWGLVTSQTGLMGLTAGLLAIPVGLTLALVLIYVINRRSFGWTLQLELDPLTLLQAPMLALVAALLAGIYPAVKMARTPPSIALREE